MHPSPLLISRFKCRFKDFRYLTCFLRVLWHLEKQQQMGNKNPGTFWGTGTYAESELLNFRLDSIQNLQERVVQCPVLGDCLSQRNALDLRTVQHNQASEVTLVYQVNCC